MKNSRPLSKINSRSIINEEESDIFSIKKKEASARNSPYLSHLKTKDREELLMELGSIVNTIDEELSVEVEIKKMMSKIVRKPKNSKSTNKTESKKSILTYDLDYLEENEDEIYTFSDYSTKDPNRLKEEEEFWGFNTSEPNQDKNNGDFFLSYNTTLYSYLYHLMNFTFLYSILGQNLSIRICPRQISI